MDLVIRDAHVIDGTGGAAYRADVGLRGRPDRRDPQERRGAPPHRGRDTVDADGLVLRPASSTCTPTATSPCSATPTTARRPPRASPWRSSARTACPTRPWTTAPSPRSARPSPAGTATATTSTSTGARSASTWTAWTVARRPRHRRQRRVPHPAGHRPDVRGRLGRPRRRPPPSSTGCGSWSPRAWSRAPSACRRG